MFTDYNKKSGITSPGAEHKSVKRGMEFLSENLGEKISLDNAAKEAGLSSFHFLRVFKNETGVSPHVFRTIRRIESAKKLITGGMPLPVVAVETGFTDQSHLSRNFRQYTGATPGQYQAN